MVGTGVTLYANWDYANSTCTSLYIFVFRATDCSQSCGREWGAHCVLLVYTQPSHRQHLSVLQVAQTTQLLL